MGRDTKKLEVTGTVSRHNSDEDRRDDALWDSFVQEVNVLALEERFEPLGLMVFP